MKSEGVSAYSRFTRCTKPLSIISMLLALLSVGPNLILMQNEITTIYDHYNKISTQRKKCYADAERRWQKREMNTTIS